MNDFSPEITNALERLKRAALEGAHAANARINRLEFELDTLLVTATDPSGTRTVLLPSGFLEPNPASEDSLTAHGIPVERPGASPDWVPEAVQISSRVKLRLEHPERELSPDGETRVEGMESFTECVRAAAQAITSLKTNSGLRAASLTLGFRIERSGRIVMVSSAGSGRSTRCTWCSRLPERQTSWGRVERSGGD